MKSLSYLSQKTIVKDSPIHCKGLFAKEAILKDEVVAIKGGYIFDRSTLEKVENELGPAEIQIDTNFFIGPVSATEREGAMLFLNHSCQPNVYIQGQIVFVAMRDIKQGEELTHDWATTDDDDYQMECNCGSQDCRGIITGKDWQNKDLQKKYHGCFAWYLERKIKAMKGE